MNGRKEIFWSQIAYSAVNFSKPLRNSGLAGRLGRAEKFRAVEEAFGPVHIVRRGKLKSMNEQHRKSLERHQVIEPTIGHAKTDDTIAHCWLQHTAGGRCVACGALRGVFQQPLIATGHRR